MTSMDRVAGCLLGVAAGDAMGMPSELMSRSKVKSDFGLITGFAPAPLDHPIVAGYEAGRFTDDTCMTLCVAESIISCGGQVDPRAIGRAILDWAEATDAFAAGALGPSSRMALAALKQGVPAEQTGIRGDTNGAAMRVAPIAMISSPSDIGQLVERVHQASMVTHNTNIAIAGAAMLAAAMSAAMETADWQVIWSAARAAFELGADRGQDTFGASSWARLALALGFVDKDNDHQRLMDDLYDLIGAGIATTESVPVAMALAYEAKGDPGRAILSAANLGGDCDTIGAMAGGLAGAYAGASAFPLGWRATIEEVNSVDLMATARALHAFRN